MSNEGELIQIFFNYFIFKKRISQKCRQEFLGMQAKYNALESRSKEILMSQGSAVSGATVALTGLNGRIEHLVEQLITSYNISERDLEVSYGWRLSINVL